MGTQKSQCGLLRLRGPHSCAPTMSWLLDKASALLDAADGSAADIAKDQGFGEEENARDKVKKRKEARRAAQVKKEKADAQAVAAAAENSPEIDEAAEAQQADGPDAEAVSSEEPSDGVEQDSVKAAAEQGNESAPGSPLDEPPPPTVLPSTKSTAAKPPAPRVTNQTSDETQQSEPADAELPPPPPSTKLLMPPNARPVPPPAPVGSGTKLPPSDGNVASDGAIIEQLKELRIALQEKTAEAAENLEAMEEAEKAAEGSEEVALDLQKKAADAEDVLSENQEFDTRMAELRAEGQVNLEAAQAKAASELAAVRASYDDQLKQFEDNTGTMALEHASAASQSTQMIQKLQVETTNAQLAVDEQRSAVRQLQEEALARDRGFEAELEAMRDAVVKAESALSHKTIELDKALEENAGDDVEFRMRSELFEAQQQLAAENTRATSLEAQLGLEVESREEATTALQRELAETSHRNAALEAELAAAVASAAERNHDQSKVGEMRARNQEMANSLVLKQGKIDELISSRQAVQMRGEADKLRVFSEVEKLQKQIIDLNGDGGDLEKGMPGQGGLTNRRA